MNSFHVKEFWIQKEGNLPEQYEDAYAYDENLLLFALADGATESCFSKYWASLLVNNFVQSPFSFDSDLVHNMERWLQPIRDNWYSGIDWKNLPWYVETKARMGAFSSFLGLKIYEEEKGKKIISIAVGDSCLFLVRDDRVEYTFPIKSSGEFSNRPRLIGSRLPSNRAISNISVEKLNIYPGDSLILATDALCKWFLESVECGQNPWKDLDFGSIQEFREFITSLRNEGSMRNDDVTLLLVKMS